jgi:hypothetical protein
MLVRRRTLWVVLLAYLPVDLIDSSERFVHGEALALQSFVYRLQ